MGGTYGNRALSSNGFNLQFNVGTLNAAGAPIQGVMQLTTSGITGITSGNSYNLDVYAVTTGVVSILPDGSMKAYNS